VVASVVVLSAVLVVGRVGRVLVGRRLLSVLLLLLSSDRDTAGSVVEGSGGGVVLVCLGSDEATSGDWRRRGGCDASDAVEK
jgi:hypothetical protein